ncbi:MAG: hypothetical protein GXP08_04865 [Gammaproteobacteria bacterium]|nr:hypothetical protein [Gammaproteobacteria bacterium]
MPNHYFILKAEVDHKVCVITEDAEGVVPITDHTSGRTLKGIYPENAELYMDEDHSGMRLLDFVANHLTYLIVSKKVKQVLQQEGVDNIEYWPVLIYDQKKRLASSDYCILNVLGTVDCLDHENSEYDRSILDPARIQHFDKVVFHEDKVPEDVKIFRLKDREAMIFIRNDLLDALKKNNLKGFEVLRVGENVFI